MFFTAKRKRTSLLISSSVAVLSAVALASPTCYYPDGSIAQSDSPCGNETGVACCGQGGICLSNGLCMDVAQPNTLARSSCTDKTWNSENCPNYCLQDSAFNKSGCSIILFSYLDSKAEYCCNNMDASGNTPICAFNYSTFQVPDSSILPGYALLSNYTTLANATSSTGSTSNNDHNVTIGVGLGLGVPLGLIAIASIAWALWERLKLDRYRAKTSQNLKTPVPYSESAHQQQAYSMTPMNVGAYGQPTQTYHNNQPTPAVLSEMENRGPVELDSRK